MSVFYLLQKPIEKDTREHNLTNVGYPTAHRFGKSVNKDSYNVKKIQQTITMVEKVTNRQDTP